MVVEVVVEVVVEGAVGVALVMVVVVEMVIVVMEVVAMWQCGNCGGICGGGGVGEGGGAILSTDSVPLYSGFFFAYNFYIIQCLHSAALLYTLLWW